MNTNLVEYEFLNSGKQIGEIDVKISHRIIELFSEGLYSSPNKAVEELVSNAFDADAQNVNVILSPDLKSETGYIIVVDDGEGMDGDGLRQHWVIGKSLRRERSRSKLGRKPIGKFGIGKLATYVLARNLTHICKFQGEFFAATMDYTRMNELTKDQGIFAEESIDIPLRSLTEIEAQDSLEEFVSGSGMGFSALNLFGKGAKDSWTVAILTNLTEMGSKIQRGRLG